MLECFSSDPTNAHAKKSNKDDYPKLKDVTFEELKNKNDFYYNKERINSLEEVLKWMSKLKDVYIQIELKENTRYGLGKSCNFDFTMEHCGGRKMEDDRVIIEVLNTIANIQYTDGLFPLSLSLSRSLSLFARCALHTPRMSRKGRVSKYEEMVR